MKNRLGRIAQAGVVDFIEREIPPLQNHQVLVKIMASCICGSDLHIYKDKHPAVRLPVTIGHEFSGIVEAVGSDVTKVRVGDRVTVEPILTCGTCDACRHGNYGYCENVSFTYRQGDGSMAYYFVGEDLRIFPLPDDVSFQAGALTEPMAVALHAVRRAQITLGDRVVIIGAGAIGILIAGICRRLGAAEVVISDLSPRRLEMAEKLGATRTVCAAEEDVVEVVASMSCGKGFDKSFECVGREQTLKQAIHTVKTNGLVTNVGIFEQPDIHLNVAILVNKELRLQGSQGYCWDFDDAIRLLRDLDAQRLITHTYALDDLQQAFDTALDPRSGAIKVCIEMP